MMKTKIVLLITVFLLGIYSCSKPKYKARNGGKRITSIKPSGYKHKR